MQEDLPFVRVVRKTGSEPFTDSGEAGGPTLQDFWKWSTSDLLSNATRGVLAEYLVAVGLGLDEGVRREWDSHDLEMPNGLKIEVKSAAYLQTWFQRRLSNIVFSIRPTQAWDYKTNLLEPSKERHADLYVFALLHHRDKLTVNPLDLSQWTFYVLATDVLNRLYPTAATIGLTNLRKAGARECCFNELKTTLEQCATTAKRRHIAPSEEGP